MEHEVILERKPGKIIATVNGKGFSWQISDDIETGLLHGINLEHEIRQMALYEYKKSIQDVLKFKLHPSETATVKQHLMELVNQLADHAQDFGTATDEWLEAKRQMTIILEAIEKI